MGKNFLIVDDDEDVLNLLKMVLEQGGHTVRVAADGREALDQIDRQRPDLIVLDLMMPRINGYQLFAHLKTDEKLKSVPIIVITALTRESDREDGEWARRMGADGFLTKPFEIKELSARIQDMVARFL